MNGYNNNKPSYNGSANGQYGNENYKSNANNIGYGYNQPNYAQGYGGYPTYNSQLPVQEAYKQPQLNVPIENLPHSKNKKTKKEKKKGRFGSFIFGFFMGIIFIIVAVVGAGYYVTTSLKVQDLERMLNISIVKDSNAKGLTLYEFIGTVADTNNLTIEKVEGLFGQVLPTTYDATINEITSKYISVPDFRKASINTIITGVNTIVNNINVTDAVDALSDFTNLPGIVVTLLNNKFGSNKFINFVNSLGSNIQSITVQDAIVAYETDSSNNLVVIDETVQEILDFAKQEYGTIPLMSFIQNIEGNLNTTSLLGIVSALDSVIPSEFVAVVSRVYGEDLSIGSFINNFATYLRYLNVEDILDAGEGFGFLFIDELDALIRENFGEVSIVDFLTDIGGQIGSLEIKAVADAFGINYQVSQDVPELNMIEQVVADCVVKEYTVQDVLDNYETIINDRIGDLTVGDIKDMVGIDLTQYIKSLELTDKLSTLATKFEELTLGDVFGESSDNLLNIIKDVKLSEVSDENNGIMAVINDSKISELIDLGVNPSGLMAALGELTIGSLSNEGSIQNAISDLTIADIIDIDHNSSKLMQALADIKIGNLATDAENAVKTLTIADFVTINSSSPAILKAIQNVQIENLASSISGLKIKDIVGADSAVCKLFVDGGDTLLSNIETGMKDFSTLTIVEIAEIAGITDSIPEQFRSYNLQQIIALLNSIE